MGAMATGGGEEVVAAVAAAKRTAAAAMEAAAQPGAETATDVLVPWSQTLTMWACYAPGL